MHVPDGFLGPTTWVPMTVAAGGLWVAGLRGAARSVDAAQLPRVGVLTAAAFGLNLLSIPLPGGSTAHFTGAAVLAIAFGLATAFLCLSLVLALQALTLGMGGITAWGLSALAVGGVGVCGAWLCWRAVRRLSERAARFAAGWVSVVVASACVAFVLGLQARIATDAAGTPLFFPFGWEVVVPALVVPHLVVGVGEGVLTVLLLEAFERAQGRAPERQVRSLA